jgi:hypothetical protein
MRNFRPISLINYCFKIFTKVLANRFPRIIIRLISYHCLYQREIILEVMKSFLWFIGVNTKRWYLKLIMRRPLIELIYNLCMRFWKLGYFVPKSSK